MALREMPCAAASALKRASQASKVPLVRQSVAEAAVAAMDATMTTAAQNCLPIQFMFATAFPDP